MARFGTLALGALLLALSTPALAGRLGPTNLDRPDFVDVDLGFSGPVHGPMDYSYANVEVEGLRRSMTYGSSPGSPGYYSYSMRSEAPVDAEGFAAGSADGTAAYLSWELYEPDHLRRKETEATVKQNDWVALSLFLSGATSTSVEDVPVKNCKGSFRVKSLEATPRAIWRMRCTDAAFDGLGLSAAQIQAVQAVFGSRLDLKNRGSVEFFED